MPTTPGGIVYPGASSDPKISIHFKNLADSIQTLFNGSIGAPWINYTPVLTGGGSAAYATLTGYWRYVGPKLVSVNIYVAASAAGSGSTIMTITLPTAPERTTRQAIPGHSEGADSSGALADAWLVCFTSGSGTVVDRLRVASSSGALSNLTGSRVTSGLILNFQGLYREA